MRHTGGAHFMLQAQKPLIGSTTDPRGSEVLPARLEIALGHLCETHEVDVPKAPTRRECAIQECAHRATNTSRQGPGRFLHHWAEGCILHPLLSILQDEYCNYSPRFTQSSRD
ncbi:hypothetical protein NDU88_000855 [Pleurodeles waltl]|uniref:Uncharacterized protein n=1 Tax=Pleurodeles waltl TaxID=8319 RepID=A0AAV7KMZ7_PLEWA|nr:hypothetical protein NDU88_000855 [Pleurodeles waltl]